MRDSLSDLGVRLDRKQVQELLGISEDTLLADPVRFGGVWLGPRKLVFFERLISEAIRELYAIQKEQKGRACLDRSREAPKWEENREVLHYENTGGEMGIHPAIRSFACENGSDLWSMADKKN